MRLTKLNVLGLNQHFAEPITHIYPQKQTVKTIFPDTSGFKEVDLGLIYELQPSFIPLSD